MTDQVYEIADQDKSSSINLKFMIIDYQFTENHPISLYRSNEPKEALTREAKSANITSVQVYLEFPQSSMSITVNDIKDSFTTIQFSLKQNHQYI